MKKTAILLTFVLLALLAFSGVAQASATKVEVCHLDETGTYFAINISENAFPAHVEHGDASPGEPVPGMPGKKFDENCNVVDAGPVVTTGYSGLTEAAGVRYRGNSSGNEIYLGIPDLGVAGNRIEVSYPNVYVNWQDGNYAVTFSYSPVTNAITTTINGPGGTGSLTYDFDDRLAPGCPVANWNTMDINVVDRLTTGELAFNNVMLDVYPLGDFDSEGWNNWTVSAYNFGQGFVISGDMIVQGWTGSETNKLQLAVGCLP